MAKTGKSQVKEPRKAQEKAGNTENRKSSGTKHSKMTSINFLQNFSVTVTPIRR